LRELLRERARTRHDAPVPERLTGRARHRQRVDARVNIEPRIFGSEQRAHERGCNVRYAHVLGERATVGTHDAEQPAMSIDDPHARCYAFDFAFAFAERAW
jgi:hypothetical protein